MVSEKLSSPITSRFWALGKNLKRMEQIARLVLSETNQPIVSLSIRSDKSGSLELESVRGNDQYFSGTNQPLEVTWLAHGQALLFPTANIVSKPLPRRTEKTGEMKHGRYKIELTYRLNGQDYECHFDVVYKINNETGIVGPWSGKDIH
jgi:hypothetical protein